MNEFKSTFVRDNFDFEERVILNDIAIRPNKALIIESMKELLKELLKAHRGDIIIIDPEGNPMADVKDFGEKDSAEDMKTLINGLMFKVENMSPDEIEIMYDELPVEEHTGLSEQMLQARLQEEKETEVNA